MTEGRIDMKNKKIRINKITLNDLKSVANGTIHLSAADSLRQEKANIMGLYGQNASGKTVVIEALAIIEIVMSGGKIPFRYMGIIANGKDECSIEVEFLVVNEEYNTDCTAIYKCALAYRNDPNDTDEEDPKKLLAVVSERLRVRGTINGERVSLQDVARTDESCSLILPAEKCTMLFGTNQSALKALEQQKILALYGSRSFIFSSQAINGMRQAVETGEEHYKFWAPTFILYLNLYAKLYLSVIDGRVGHNLHFHIMKNQKELRIPMRIPFLLNDSIKMNKDGIDEVVSLLPPLNHVLSGIVPGLTLGYEYEKISLDESDESYRLEFYSHRDGLGSFPFRDESLGIKKIVSFIVLLIEAYNNPSFTLAIDEMDSGIFEYLLGEILDIMGSSGKGQLLFTSHNLRPLERLDPRFVWFTTADPVNRYAQMKKKPKATNNLRDMYLRAIQLGHEDKELYNGDSKHALAHAFRKMGRTE